ANDPAELIVVDGDSTDRTVEIAREYAHLVCSDEGRGKSYARQLGAEQASQEYVAYVDADVTMFEGALLTMLTELQESNCASLHATLAPDMECSTYWQWAQHQQYLLASRREIIGMLCCIMKRDLILQFGFDPSAGGLDDTVLELKMRHAGLRFGASSALVHHAWPADMVSLVKYRVFLGRLTPRAMRKYGIWHPGFWPPLSTAYWLAVSVIKGKPGLIPYLLVEGAAKTAGMMLGFYQMLKEEFTGRVSR
ncbi:MAG: glycosyltransferase family 2 protein, partial [Dehalococcoidia bacterium]